MRRSRKYDEHVSQHVHQASSNYGLVNSFRRLLVISSRCRLSSAGIGGGGEGEGFRGNSRSRESLPSTTLKVDPTRWKFCESCETTAAGDGGSKHVLLPGFSRCHDLTNTLHQFRVELTSENQSASLKRRLPGCLPACLPACNPPCFPSSSRPTSFIHLYSCTYGCVYMIDM